jgi:methionyl-tRNA synthetase
VPGYEDQRIYSWLNMIAGYVIAAREAHGWPAWEPEVEVVQFFGFDNRWFHSLFYTCAVHDPWWVRARPPVRVLYRLDGLKFSISPHARHLAARAAGRSTG